MKKLKKRQYRELSDITKTKISQKLKGKGKSPIHKQKISEALTAYWQTIPAKIIDNNNGGMPNETK